MRSTSNGRRGQRLADGLRGRVGGFKIGSRLFTATDPPSSRNWGRGDRVFLDLKFHDIPEYRRRRRGGGDERGAWMVNVHASGGLEMMTIAKRAAREAAQALNRPAPLIIAVTVLTSLSDEALGEIGFTRTMERQVEAMAALAVKAGLDGVVASPRELRLLRRSFPDLMVVTPGIRSSSAPADDQARTMNARGCDRRGRKLPRGRPADHRRRRSARRRRRDRAVGAVILTIYSRPGCHLCEEMKSLVQQVALEHGNVAVEEVDISNKPNLLSLYELEIPVLTLDGRKIAKYRISREQLIRSLAS